MHVFTSQFGTIEYKTPTIRETTRLIKKFGSSFSILFGSKKDTDLTDSVGIYSDILDIIYDGKYMVKIDLVVNDVAINTQEAIDENNSLLPEMLRLSAEFIKVCFGEELKKNQ